MNLQSLPVSPLALGGFLFFLLMTLASAFLSGDFSILLIALPILLFLLLIPAALGLMTRREYTALVPFYEEEAVSVSLMQAAALPFGRCVRVRGTVASVSMRFIGRPRYRIVDKKGEITVAIMVPPLRKIKSGDKIVALGAMRKSLIEGGRPLVAAVKVEKESWPPAL